MSKIDKKDINEQLAEGSAVFKNSIEMPNLTSEKKDKVLGSPDLEDLCYDDFECISKK